MTIMNFISYFAIPINVIILLVCRFPKVQVGASQNQDELDFEEKSVLAQYLEKEDSELWTRPNIILMAIFLEHIIIGFKIALALVIPDVPIKVVEDEFRRTNVEQQVIKQLLEIKYSGNHETFQDMQDRLQRQAAEIMEQNIKE